MFVIYYFIYKKMKKRGKKSCTESKRGKKWEKTKNGKKQKMGNGKGHTDGNVFHLDKNGSGTSGLY